MLNMVKISILLLFLWEVNSVISLCAPMEFSDAQPVQFWPIACDTHNSNHAPGVYHQCFCQLWECDDEIPVQFSTNPDASPEEGENFSLSLRDEEGGEIISIPFEASSSSPDPSKTFFNASFIPSELSPELCNTKVLMFVRNDDTDEDVAHSDCQDIQAEQDTTILINYRNHVNVFGLAYDGNSFNIRVRAVFFHQRFPEEDETLELSSSLVALNGSMRRQRKLETDYMPYYMHEKIKLILKHQFVTIFDKEWVKQEGYEIVEGSKKYPSKMATCWISEKDFVQRNVL